ncbi:MarR family winged helix-turn-helix transcriptional regulator [Planococcus salinarum]|uniref:MarR family winged helix-turn-helix transcriptional regulator n=1 Tax=Planococcus salinarum TaxID=622695 RepID=UPI000E3C46A7|nr:MarR family transcriptional regulator [Planococcus salinarum]TAA70502.1 MarR family transcriptional regulator [Planococcus salinarum]
MELPNRNLKAVTVIIRAADAVREVIKSDAASNGLNPTEFSVLELLYHQGRQPIQSIGKKVLIASSSITYVVDKLEAKNFVRRSECAEDRRVTYAELTEEGKGLMDRIWPEHENKINELFAGLTVEETEAMISDLKKVGYQALKI